MSAMPPSRSPVRWPSAWPPRVSATASSRPSSTASRARRAPSAISCGAVDHPAVEPCARNGTRPPCHRPTRIRDRARSPCRTSGSAASMASRVPLCKLRHAAQVVVVGVQAFRRLALGALDLGPFELRRDRADDAFRDLVLQFEDVVERAFEALRPEMRAGRGVDQLPGDAHPVAGLAHAAFQHVAHAKLAADLLHVHGPALVGEARIARDDEQPADARQRGDDVLDHAVGEIFLLGVAAQVLERQDGDGGLVWQGERGAAPSAGSAAVRRR